MKKSNGQKTSVMAIILYVAAIIMGLLAVFNAYNAYTYVSGLVAQGMQISEQLVEVTNYYITTITPYVFYGLTLAGLAYIAKKVSGTTETVETVNVVEENLVEEVVEESKED